MGASRMAPWTIALVLAVCSLAVACGGGELSADCEGIDCSGHGSCALAGGEPACTCDPGWELDPDDRLACVESLPEAVVVDVVTGLGAPDGQLVTVSLRSHRPVTLELGPALADVWQDFLELSRDQAHPVYLDLEPESRLILDVTYPLVSPVMRLQPEDDAVWIELVYSAAIHFLYRTHPRFEALLAVLEAALASGDSVVLAEKDGEGVVDVRADTFSAGP